ncbi:MAG: YqeG family HAD IIIA-type phosphatase [Lachnospiraceae bacterium]|nr:YqeG family HAD IIIA-type phosphatase [Lachnospiraceae bacterium]
MFESFFPDECVGSAYDIDYERLYAEGYRGIIYDIDNTLVPHDAPADERSIDLFARLSDIGFSCLVLSNNKEPRVKSFADDVGAMYIHKAGKPGKAGYLKAMEKLGTDVDSTIFIGDQLFTDVWGAKRSGIRNILVDQIDEKEEIQIVLKRILERIVMWFYRRSRDDRDIV